MQEKTGNPEFTLNGKPKAEKAVMKMDSPMKETMTKINSPAANSNEMWTDLYQPKSKEDLVGNEGLVEQLEDWLKDWDDVHIRGNKKTIGYGNNNQRKGGFGGAGGGQ